MAKPLISPLLLENSNSRASTLDTSQSSFRPLLNNTLLVLLSTPRKSVEIKAQIKRYKSLDTNEPLTRRLLFRKITKDLRIKRVF